jgi:hypothetical protein
MRSSYVSGCRACNKPLEVVFFCFHCGELFCSRQCLQRHAGELPNSAGSPPVHAKAANTPVPPLRSASRARYVPLASATQIAKPVSTFGG